MHFFLTVAMQQFLCLKKKTKKNFPFEFTFIMYQYKNH